MNTVLWLTFIIFGAIIIAPLIQGDLFKVDKKYHFFKGTSIILLIWWVIDFLKLVSANGPLIYYLTLLVYPVVLLFIIVFYIAIHKHFNTKIKPITYILLGMIFVVDLVVSLTNSFHYLFFNVESLEQYTFEISRFQEMNYFFNIHSGVSYVLLLMVVFYILKNVFKRVQLKKDIFPFVFITIAILVGFTLNVIHVYVYTFHLDPSLLTSAIVLSALYYIFYIRDLKLLLGFNRNRFIIDHLREKYIVVDEMGNVVDASTEFMTQFGISLEESISYDELVNIMSETSVLFNESEEKKVKYKDGMIYLNTLEKAINLPFYRHSGTFYLFFDQTANLKYIYDMNYIKSHDLMTKIYNRNFLEDLRDEVDDGQTPFVIAMFDLDGLKLYNDYLGHHSGDDLLIKFASQLKEISKEDEVYPIRLGGDEFIILALNKDKDYLESLITSMISKNTNLPFLEQVQFSYAISVRDEDKNSIKEVLAHVDQVMYSMKNEKSDYKEALKTELEKIKHS